MARMKVLFFNHIWNMCIWADMSTFKGCVATRFWLSWRFSVKYLGWDHEVSRTVYKHKSRTEAHPEFKVCLSLTWAVMLLKLLNQSLACLTAVMWMQFVWQEEVQMRLAHSLCKAAASLMGWVLINIVISFSQLPFTAGKGLLFRIQTLQKPENASGLVEVLGVSFVGLPKSILQSRGLCRLHQIAIKKPWLPAHIFL